MIRKWMCALALCAMLLIGCAAAQTLPDNAVFSPGLMRLSQAMAGDPVVTAQAQVRAGTSICLASRVTAPAGTSHRICCAPFFSGRR